MGGGLSHAPADLLLFSERVYWRLFLLENAALWPLPLVAPVALAGAGLALHARRPEAGLRLLLALLALAWLSVGWHFVWQRYAPVNWAMAWLAPLFAVQAAIFAGLALRGPRARAATRPARWIGHGLLLAGTVAYPFLAPLQGRTLAGAEVAGLAPDPTAVAGLAAALLIAKGWRRLAVLLLPALWLAQSALTLYVLNGPAALPPALALAAALAGLATPEHRPKGGRRGKS